MWIRILGRAHNVKRFGKAHPPVRWGIAAQFLASSPIHNSYVDFPHISFFISISFSLQSNPHCPKELPNLFPPDLLSLGGLSLRGLGSHAPLSWLCHT
ncbi:hypothetical protein E2P81_ATG09111 [Venturia nashicola]|nr:hypothetical protein E2P81_ATG09111 [Venturia nashicola]